MENSKVKNYILKIGFMISTILLVLPSILYFFRNGNTTFVDKKFEFKFLMVDGIDGKTHMIVYLAVVIVMILLYALIIKKRKELFKDIKSVISFIALISIISACSLPFMCSDVYYYLGTGRLDSEYKQNPYYVDIKSYVDNNDVNLENDSVMETGYNNFWSKTTVVYGAVWTMICTIVAKFSFGSLNVGILIFKLLNVLIHVLNCILLYKISKKKIFPLIYGLNPFVLLEGIINVHNDIYMVFFILLALYLVCKKKKLVFGLLSLAMATDIKYVAIMLLPLLIIYHFRDKSIKVRILKCIQYGIIFMVFAMLPYILYIRDLDVFLGLSAQQARYAKGLYCFLYVRFPEIKDYIGYIRVSFMYLFGLVYLMICIRLLVIKEIKWYKEIRKVYVVFLVFLFFMLTNFQPWYFVWLSSFIVWQKARNIKLIPQMQVLTIIADAVFVLYSEAYIYAREFFETFIFGIIFCIFMNVLCKSYRLHKARAQREKLTL